MINQVKIKITFDAKSQYLNSGLMINSSQK